MTSTAHTPPLVGPALDRVDGRSKVTGTARYSAEFPITGLTHAVMIQSAVATGRITGIDVAAAAAVPGVLAIMTHRNAPRMPPAASAAPGRVLTLLQDDRVHYNGQPVAVVIADSFEHATDAASRVRVTYASSAPMVDLHAALGTATPAPPPPPAGGGAPPATTRGDVAEGLRLADARIDQTYTTPGETHSPMEPHATIAEWNGDQLTIYDSTQYVTGTQTTVAKAFSLAPDRVHVVSPFVGGGFGGKGSTWSHVILAAMAARTVQRPVKLVLTRRQMFGPVGGRPPTVQHVVLGATRDGRLTAITHESTSHTSRLEEWLEPSAVVTRMLYACPNVVTKHNLVALDVGTPTFMRAPGESTGTFALESAMDELAYALQLDPLELRLRNYAEREPESGRPWSSKSLRQCYAEGAARFGWTARAPKVRAMRDGNELVGYGMATATYPTHRLPASASARIERTGDGGISALVRSGTQDLGTGTYTIMTQVAADALGLAPEQVHFELGDSTLPPSPVSGGSMTTASTGSAVHAAGEAARGKLVALAIADPNSPLHGVAGSDVQARDGRLISTRDPSIGDSYADIIGRNAGRPVEVRVDVAPGAEIKQYAMHSFGAVFVEVRVDADLGRIRIPRIVGAYGAGRILNAKTGHSQFMGGIVWGVSMALLEQTLLDQRTGRVMNADLAEYHVPVNADIAAIDVIMVPEDDQSVNPIGVKGIGEIGITGVAAAVANAVYHATGVRVRDLPITLDKVLEAPTA